MKPIAITTGDHGGIGPEVIAKGLKALGYGGARAGEVILFGDPSAYEPFAALLPRNWIILSDDEARVALRRGLRRGALHFVLPRVPAARRRNADDYLCGRSIEVATAFVMEKLCSALVTGPIDKSALRNGGYRYAGHTDMLKDLTGAPAVTMMMAAPGMRVCLATTHIALSAVPRALTKARILQTIVHAHGALKSAFGIKNPRIAVLGLNPHGGDNGLFGKEEIRVIAPAVAAARQKRIMAEGPFPPDGFFARYKDVHGKSFDAVVCMYHDQALIPVKLHDFRRAINVTLGLPIIRTSVDHGVGRDIAGRGVADPTSFMEALKLARIQASRVK